MSTPLSRPEASATFTLPTPVEVSPPGRIIYANNGAGWGAGWTTSYAANGSGITGVSLIAIGGRLWMQSQGGTTAINPTASLTAARTLTGLEVGRQYLVTGKLASFHATATRVRVAVPSTGDSSAWIVGNADTPFYMTFTATSATHVLEVQLQDNPGSSSVQSLVGAYLDDLVVMEEALYAYTAELPITDGKMTLDLGWSPYVQSELTVPLTDLSLLENIDPRAPQRVVIEAQDTIASTYRVFDLSIRRRVADHKAQTIALTLASDEALLQEKHSGLTTVDNTPRSHQTSFRAMCNWALGKIGAVLEAGIYDADVTAYWPLTNLFPNPASEHATDFVWTPGTGAPLITRSSTQAYQGTYSVRVQATASGDANASGGSYTATPGLPYTFQTHIRSSAARPARLLLRFFDQDGKVVRNVYSALTGTSSGAWQEREVTGTAPKNAARFTPFVLTESNASGNFHYIDGTLIYQGAGGEAYFSGTTNNTAEYTYTWEDGTNESASERTPVVERLRELYQWRPDQNLWEFLEPFMQETGMRLWCDEERNWFLDPQANFTAIGTLTIAARTDADEGNAVEGEDSIDRDSDEWADAVVCAYTYLDKYGLSTTKYQKAGDFTGKTRVFKFDGPPTGDNRPALLLARLQGRGRVQTLTALQDLTARPGQPVTVYLPGAAPQEGHVQSVIFDLGSGPMGVQTRDLVEALP